MNTDATTSAPSGRGTWATRLGPRPALALAALAAAVVFIVALLPRELTASDVGDIRGAVAGAIEALNRDPILPPDVRPGHFSEADRQRLRAASRTNLAQHFAGQALTNALTNHLEWIDRIAVNAAESWGIFADLVRLDMDEPVMVGPAAVVSGTYTLRAQGASGLPDGRIATLGGTYIQAFTFQLERIGDRWLVTSYTDHPVDFIPDPALESNLDVDPAPGATKFIPSERPYVPPPLP